MIYLFNHVNDFSEELMRRSMRILPKNRLEKALRYRYVIDQKLSIIAYLLLIKGLRDEYGIIEMPEFDYIYNEKPILSEYPNIHFNLSHCKEGVVCIISETPVGIDIQEDTQFDYAVADRVCNEEELRRILTSKWKEREFSKLWSAKESVAKLSGIGIAQNLKNLDISKVRTYEYNSFVISVAIQH